MGNCKWVDFAYFVNTTKDQHNLWVVYQEYVQIRLKYYGNFGFESNLFPKTPFCTMTKYVKLNLENLWSIVGVFENTDSDNKGLCIEAPPSVTD